MAVVVDVERFGLNVSAAWRAIQGYMGFPEIFRIGIGVCGQVCAHIRSCSQCIYTQDILQQDRNRHTAKNKGKKSEQS